MARWSKQVVYAGRYLPERELSRGQGRQVLLCHDRLLSRRVVLKGELSSASDTGARARVVREYTILREHRHPRIARPLELVTWLPTSAPSSRVFHFFVQEYLPGDNLRKERGRLTGAAIRQILIDLLELVAHLHHRGLVGLDLKPIHFIKASAGWTLIDLGEARQYSPIERPESSGTLPYMAVELMRQEACRPSTDLYSVGAILYELLTGAAPSLEGTTLEEVATRLERSSTPPFSDRIRQANPDLCSLCERLMARSLHDRPESAGEVLKLLTNATHHWRNRIPLPEGRFIPHASLEDQIQPLLEEAAQRQGGGLALVGASGTGKSRYLAELEARLLEENRPTLRLSSSSALGPSNCAVEVMTQFLLSIRSVFTPDNQLEGGEEPSADGEAVASDPAPSSASPTALEIELPQADRRALALQQRVLALRALGRVAATATGAPIPILLDDVASLDETTRDCLKLLMPVLKGSGLLLIVSAETPLLGWLKVLPAVELPPWQLEHVRRLATDILPPPGIGSEPEAQHLLSLTEGRPGWMRDALQLRWAVPPRPLDDWHPEKTDSLLLALPVGSDRPLLEAALDLSVLEQAFSDRLIEVLVPEESIRCALLETLLTQGILIRELTGLEETTYRFAHEPARRDLEARLTPERRRELNRRVALELESRQNFDPSFSPLQVAFHFLRGGDAATAKTYLEQEVREDETGEHLERTTTLTRDLLKALPATDSSRMALGVRLGFSYFALGRYGEAKDAFQEALEGDRGEPSARARAKVGLAKSLTQLGDTYAARDLMEKLLKGDEPLPETIGLTLRAEAWQLLAWCLIRHREQGLAKDALDAAARLPLPPESRVAVEQAHLEADLELEIGNDPRNVSAARLEQAAALAERLRHDAGRGRILTAQARLHSRLGDREGALRYANAVAALWADAIDPRQEASALNNLGVCHWEANHPSEAIRALERASSLYHVLGHRTQTQVNRVLIAEICLQMGSLEEAQARIQAARAHVLEDPENKNENDIRPRKDSVSPSRSGRAPTDRQQRQAHLQLQLLELELRIAKGGLKGAMKPLESLCHEAREHSEHSIELYGRILQIEGTLKSEGEAKALERLIPLLSDETLKAGAHPDLWNYLHDLATDAHHALKVRSSDTPTTPQRPARPALGLVLHGSGQTPHASGGLTISSSSSGQAQSNFEERLKWIRLVSDLIQQGDSPWQLARSLSRYLGELFGGRGLVILFDSPRGEIVEGNVEDGVPLDDITRLFVQEVRKSKTSIARPDVRLDPRLSEVESLSKAGVRGMVCCPLMVNQQCEGVLYVDQKDDLVKITEAQGLLEEVARMVGEMLGQQQQRKKEQHPDTVHFGLEGVSPSFKALEERLSELATSKTKHLTVLFLGESGTGKSTVAERLHIARKSKNKPFIALDCGAFPTDLLESELFGTVRGAYSGAVNRPGVFERAEDGTVFLDEIGNLSLKHQMALLATLASRRYYRVGGTEPKTLDCDLFFATNLNLEEQVEQGKFRDDFLARIAVNTQTIPSLRERGKEDIIRLSRLMLTRTLEEAELLPKGSPMVELRDYLTQGAIKRLLSHSWHWNIRELEHQVFMNERIRRILFNRKSAPKEWPLLDEEELDKVLKSRPSVGWEQALDRIELPLDSTKDQLEAAAQRLKVRHVVRLYQSVKANKSKTAERLGCERPLVYKYLEEAEDLGFLAEASSRRKSEDSTEVLKVTFTKST